MMASAFCLRNSCGLQFSFVMFIIKGNVIFGNGQSRGSVKWSK